MISTAAMHARDNVGETPNEAATYWVGGGMVVGPYWDDIFEEEWIDLESRREDGTLSPSTEVWTGSFWDGKAFSVGFNSNTRFYAGAPRVEYGQPRERGLHIQSMRTTAHTPPRNHNRFTLYGISPVITVAEAAGQAQDSPGQQQ